MLARTKKRIMTDINDYAVLCFRIPIENLHRIKTFLANNGAEVTDVSIPWQKVYPNFNAATALRGARKKDALTQKQLAKVLGISQNHISEMENGKRPIGKEMARRLAKILNVDYRVFL